MASYDELNAFAAADGGFRQRVRVACIVAAHTIAGEAQSVSNHNARIKWASAVMASPDAESQRMLWFVLAANRASTMAQIQGATDAQIQSAVNAAVDLFAQG